MKRLLLTILAFLAVIAVNAEQVSKQEALQKAQQFMPDKQFKETTSFARSDKPVENEAFYIFNAEDKKGFVIVSGDDRTEPILGYSDTGCLDLDSLPPNLKGWLEGYSKQIKALMNTDIVGNRAFSRSVTRAPKAAIAPLVTTKWGQDDPYNMKCPDFFDEGTKCVTGCVATAMAQVMYYHRAKSTKKTTALIPGYYGSKCWGEDNRQIFADAIPEGAIIDWDNMLDRYNGSENDTQKEAVANLMYYCGAAVKMEYGPAVWGGSGAFSFDVPIALKRYFDYSEHTMLVWRQDYTEENWDDLIYSELSKGNPVYYSGSNSSASHAFVCDGYDGNGYYHINWGWDGLSDSFFLLSALNPSQQGTGGSSAGYNDGQCALIGAVPNGDVMRLSSQSVSLTGNTSFILNEVGDIVTVPTRWTIKNQADDSRIIDHAIGLYHNGELVKVLERTGTSETFTANQEKTLDASLNIENSLATGVYQLYALSRMSGDEKWYRNENSSNSFITLVIKDGSMTFFVGKPAVANNVINFADNEVKRICVENWDTDGDGEISYEEAASVTDFGYVFDRSIIKTFDEAQFFTGITSFGLTSYDGYSCPSLTSIKLPSSVTTIKDGAFYLCTSLTSIEIPASVKEIGNGAFYCCFSLQEVVLHEGLEKINDEAFYKCAISSIHFPASLSSLNGIIWYGCENLNDFYVDDNSSHYCAIDGVLFSKDRKKLVYFPCKREGNYSIPEGTEVISSCAFDYSKLEAVTIPTSVTCIERSGFDSMSNLHEITIPSTVTTIQEMAFYGCVSLESVSFEGSISTIPDGMFMHCWSLKKIKFPDNLTLIGPHTFHCCSSLMEIGIPSTVISIGDYAFASSGLRRVKSYMQSPCAINSTVFDGISSNSILFVPEESLTAYKEADNWKDFTHILSIEEKGNEQYAVLDNGVLSFYFDTYREERVGEIYEMFPNWIEKAHSITKVIFDTSFANARPTATDVWFSECDKLTEIQGIENLNTSEVTTMLSMFNGCSSLTSIDLSSFNTTKVTDMWAMFSGCSNLTSIDLSSFDVSKVTRMENMFWVCNNLKTVKLPDNLTFIDSYQFVDCSSLTNISLPASVTSIGDNAFARCTSLDEMTIPSKVTAIGDGAFSGCYSLEEITIPANVTSIGDNAFAGTSLVEVTIPSKVTVIGDGAFAYSGLTKVKSLMQTPCEINSTVFENVSNNATLYVPAGCKAIYEAASPWNEFKKIVEIITEVPISISGSGKTTLTSSEALDFSGFDDLKAYVATGYEGSGTIWLTRVKQIPANTPILIKGEADKTYEVPVMDKCDGYFENLFQGSADENQIISTTTEDGKYKNFYMAGGQFKPASASQKINAGKVYLQVPASFNAAKAGENQTVTISKNGKSSYAPPVDVDLTDVEGLKAYVATGYDAASSIIWLTRVLKIQAGEGVMLKGEADKTYTLPSVAVQAYYGNMFIGNIGPEITINETSDDGEWRNFYLGGGSFKKVSGTREIGTNKSYLHLPTSLLVSSARGKQNADIDDWFMEELETETMLLGSIGGDDDGSTRIDAIRQNNAQPDVYYNLQGQRIDNPKKGIYIHKGRKVVIK